MILAELVIPLICLLYLPARISTGSSKRERSNFDQQYHISLRLYTPNHSNRRCLGK